MADLALTAIMAIWGSTFALTRLLLGDAGGTASAISPLALIAVRMGLATLLLGLFLAATPAGRQQLRAAFQGALLRDGLLCGALLGFGFFLQVEGLQRTTASRSGFLTGLLVVLVPLLEFLFFRKRPAAPALVALALAFLGLTLLSAPGSAGASATALGDLLTVSCAVIFAGHVVLLGRVAKRHPVLPLLLLQLLCTFALAALLGPVVEAQRFAGSGRLWLAVSYLAVFATLLAFGIQTWAQKLMPAVRVALLSSLEPVFAALWAALFIGERLSGHELLGGALIVVGVLVGEAGTALRARA